MPNIEIVKKFCSGYLEQLQEEQVTFRNQFQQQHLLSWVKNWSFLTLSSRKRLDSTDLAIGLYTALSNCFVVGWILNKPVKFEADIFAVCAVWCGVANPCDPTLDVELEVFELEDETLKFVNQKFCEKITKDLNLRAIDISLNIPPQISNKVMEELVDSFLQAAVVYYTAKSLVFVRIERAED